MVESCRQGNIIDLPLIFSASDRICPVCLYENLSNSSRSGEVSSGLSKVCRPITAERTDKRLETNEPHLEEPYLSSGTYVSSPAALISSPPLPLSPQPLRHPSAAAPQAQQTRRQAEPVDPSSSPRRSALPAKAHPAARPRAIPGRPGVSTDRPRDCSCCRWPRWPAHQVDDAAIPNSPRTARPDAAP